ncbi:autophagy-related protein 2 homolog A [Anopheles maculipalpis]|uniref:autophagy-related protein 2 homolog A n=1 Tax=Anopheles maculipalpis TaxID=1496333 RepID=UPI002159AD48|nr:autophagy-related protein 2 homolog A [Anopheles maculipalpis]
MPWYAPWSDVIKKKICRFLLQRYLGQFLEEKLTLDQLNVDFYNGTGTVNNVTLYCQALNELCEGQGWGIEVTGGHIGSVTVNVPYDSLLAKDSSIEVSNLMISLRPKARPTDGTSMLESMWSSMSSSMQLAQEYLERESTGGSIADGHSTHGGQNHGRGGLASASGSGQQLPQSAMEGLENFAQIIDNVLNRIKAKLYDSEIRIEYLSPEGDRGVAVIVKIKSIDYQNEAGNDPPDRSPKTSTSSSSGSDVSDHTVTGGGSGNRQQQQKSFLIATHATHHITIEGITFYTEEFRIDNPRVRRQQQQGMADATESTTVPQYAESMIDSEQFRSTISHMSEGGSPPNVPASEADGYFNYSHTSACDNSGPSSRGTEFYRRSNSSGTDRETDPSEEEDVESEDELGNAGLRMYRSGEIIVGKITSKQEIRLKMKQTDNLPGPNVELELSVGSIQLFLTPRQLHSLVLVCDSFLGGNEEPPPQPTAREMKAASAAKRQEAATSASEMDYQHNMTRMGGGIGINQGWSLADPMQTMIEEQAEFLQRDEYRGDGGEDYSESIISSTSSMTSSFTSNSTASGTTATSAASRRRMIDPDANADISKFNVRVAAIALVLLHEDILLESSQLGAVESPLSEASVQQLQTKADRFFRSIGNLGLGLGANDVTNAGLVLDSGCDCSHLRLFLAPLILEGDEQRNRCGSLLRFSVSIARADLREVLLEVSVPLVEFYREQRPNTSGSSLPKRPEISVTFEQSSNALRGSSGKRFSPPRTKIHVMMAPFLTEFDITILDRLSSLLYQAPFTSYYHKTASSSPNSSSPNTSTSSGGGRSKLEAKTDLQLESLAVDFRLRFPIPDLRPIHDPQRVPWWRRNIRPDFLLLKLELVRTGIALSPHPVYDISANEIKLFYHESEPKAATSGTVSGGVNIGKTVMQENAAPGQVPSVEYPRIIIEIPSESSLQKALDEQLQQSAQCGAASKGHTKPHTASGHHHRAYEESDSDPTSGESIGVTTGRCKEDTPFSAKRVCRESDTPHSKTSTTGVSSDTPETLTLPGDTDEMNTFCSRAMKRAKLQIRVDLPVVSLQMKSKHLYEVIYNRISTDLLLWEPSAPSATAAAEAQLNAQQTARVSFREPEISLAGMGMMDSIYMPYTMCQSGIQLDSSSSATNSESESDSDGIFYSVYDRTRGATLDGGGASGGAPGAGRKSSSHSHRSSSHGGKLAPSATGTDTNTVAFRLNIGQGVLTMFAPVRDAQKHVIPGQFGEFVIRLAAGYIFSVSGFHGNSNLGYLCIQAKSAEFYHCGLIPTPCNSPPLRLINSVLPSYLQSTLYPTPKNLTLHEQRGCTNREMLSLAIQIKTVPDLAVKRIRLAAGIQLTTLRHHSTLQQHAWLTQLLDMLDVVDYPVQGYVPLGVVTEMHLHLWDCAIDYRPLYFPYRAVITVGSFMISSNITTTSSGLTLNFIAEDVTLSLAPQQIAISGTGAKDSSNSSSSSSSGHQAMANNSSKITVLPSNELVCVLEVGLFEISLMLNERVTVKFPKFDLRTAINDVHVRTCADSARALAQLIGYLAAEGDLLLPEGDSETSTSGAGISSAGGSDAAIGGVGALEPKDGLMQGLPMGGESEGELLPVRPPSSASGPVVTPKQQQHVNTLMADAMEESLYIESTSSGDGTGDDPLLGGGGGDGAGVEMFFFPDERQRRTKDEKDPVGGNSNKRRFGSDDDSLSIDDGSSIPSSYHDDDHYLRQHDHTSGAHLTGADVDDDNASVNMRELMNFERSVLGQHPMNYGIGDDDDDDTGVEALPQVTKELGDVNKHRVDAPNVGTHFPQRKISSDTDDDFCIIADEERPHRGEDAHNQEVPVSEDPIRIVDNHFSIPSGKPDLLKAPEDFPSAVERYTICEMTVTWHIYGGRDFLTKDDRRRKVKQQSTVGKTDKQTTVATTVGTVHLPTALPMSEAYKSGVSYSKGSPSVSFGGPANAALAKLTWKTRGGPDRKHDVTMEIHISKVQFSHETYPSNTKEASRQVLLINELEIVDGLAVSNIKKFLYHPKLPSRPTSKQSTNHMVVIKALHMRPNPALAAQECCLRVSVLPIRLNIDQDSLLFLINFFNQLGGGGDINDATVPTASGGVPNTGGRNSQTTTPAHQPPVMTVESIPDAVQELQAKKMVSENLMLLIEEEEKHKADTQESGAAYSEAGDTAPIYFRNVIFSPDVPIRIDYHGKRMELSHGSLAGLLMGLGQLQCSEIRLKKISYRHGLLGVDRLLNFLLQEWLQDIKKHQLPKIIGGFGPMYSLVQLLQGIWDLFWLPIEQYQKDGRIVRGLQRGAQSFTARTALAALEITTRIIHLLQITAETAYDMISPGPSIRRGRGNRKGKRKRLHPPQDIREGMSNAIQIVREGITETAHNLVEITALEHDQKGYTGAVGAVMRQIPPIVVQPIVLATQATSNVLGGVKNQLVPDARAEAREKYKDDVE